MTPTIGRIVIYKPTDSEKAGIKNITGYGNSPDQLPAVVVNVFSDTSCVNLKVITDAPGGTELWKTSAPLGDAPGTWNWPVKA